RKSSVHAAGAREVTRLWLAIDSMQRQLEGRPFVEMFAADLSHELKNPVAAIRASAEVLDGGAIDDPEAARRFVPRIREATERIERLLKELLGLASIEARGVEGFASVDVARLAGGILEHLDEQRSRTDFVSEGDTRVRGDEVWLGRAVHNLVNNALVHSDVSARVSIGVRREGNDVVIHVENPGTVPAHVRTRAFRRFAPTPPHK